LVECRLNELEAILLRAQHADILPLSSSAPRDIPPKSAKRTDSYEQLEQNFFQRLSSAIRV
jgi:hypothetical protein